MQLPFKKSLILEIPATSILLTVEFWSLRRSLFGRLQQNNAPNQYEKDPYNLERIQNKVVAFIQETLKEQDLKVSLDISLQEAISETIDNAYDAHIEQARLRHPLTLKVVVKTESDKLLINIMDNGSGFLHMPKSAAFHRTDIQESTKDRHDHIGGMGIGLKILDRKVSAANGSLFFKNRKDQGATVSVQLPLQDPPSKRLAIL